MDELQKINFDNVYKPTRPNDKDIKQSLNKKKGYSMMPNIIPDTLPLGPLAVYTLIKRRAGERGVCTKSQRTMSKSLCVDHRTIGKSVDYLEKRGLIKKAGITPSKGKPIQNWSIVDIWQKNREHLAKISKKKNA